MTVPTPASRSRRQKSTPRSAVRSSQPLTCLLYTSDIFQSIIEAIQNENIQPTSISQFEFPVINIGEIKIFPAQRRVVKAGKQIHLNYGEFSMLCCMAKSPGQVFSREQLYASAWGESYNWSSNTVDNTIWRLRKKLESNPKKPVYIKTVFRLGYKIELT